MRNGHSWGCLVIMAAWSVWGTACNGVPSSALVPRCGERELDARQKGPLEVYLAALSSTGEARVLEHESAASMDEEQRRVMIAHHALLYDGVRAEHRFLDHDGHPVDCIPWQDQLGLRHPDRVPAGPPEPPLVDDTELTSSPGLADPLYGPERFDEEGNVMLCPAGTVGLRRVLLEDMACFPGLDAYHAKHGVDPRASGSGGRAVHRYALGSQDVTNHGGSAHLNVWSPQPSEHGMSLSQLWVSGGSGGDLQTVEVGWQVYPDLYGDANPHLFVFHTSDGYGPSSCYNGTCGELQLHPAARYHPGAALSSISEQGGAQADLGVEVVRNSEGDWWIRIIDSLGSSWLGHYPRSSYERHGDGEEPLTSSASRVQFGGEVSGDPSGHGDDASGQMGSGQHASEGFGQAAYQQRLRYRDDQGHVQWADLDPEASDPWCYDLSVTNQGPEGPDPSSPTADGRPSGTHLYFGGPSCSGG